jgi:hypothetical protein
MPDIWLHPVNGEQDLSLLLESGLDPRFISQVQGHQLFIAFRASRLVGVVDSSFKWPNGGPCHKNKTHQKNDVREGRIRSVAPTGAAPD